MRVPNFKHLEVWTEWLENWGWSVPWWWWRWRWRWWHTVGWSCRSYDWVCRNTLVLDVSNVPVDVVSVISYNLRTAVRKSNPVLTLHDPISILGLFLVKVGTAVVVRDTISVGKGSWRNFHLTIMDWKWWGSTVKWRSRNSGWSTLGWPS